MKSELPIIGITMGDPAGIGCEVILKALRHPEIYALCRPVVCGDLAWIEQVSRDLQLPVRVLPDTEGVPDTDMVCVRQATRADLSEVHYGELSAHAGRAAAECVIVATHLAMENEFDAIVTAPLNKEAMALGGYPYPGHTELLAEVTHTPKYGMFLSSGNLRVIHVSTHVSLREAIERVRTPRIIECIRLGQDGCRQLGITNPRVAVAGLNPHAGENGLFGTEEVEEIAPAIQLARDEGILASGPHPPDTIFARTALGEFDVVVAMYHDQGHIPVKLHGFDSGVNITLGLPIIRVSVDHGTAFDIAWQGIAREESLLEAVRVAVQMVHARTQTHMSL